MITNWRKTSYTEPNDNCVELGFDRDDNGAIDTEGVQDSKARGVLLLLRPGAHRRLLQHCKGDPRFAAR